jgi:glucuronate isomerase
VKTFITEDFLLQTETARELYHDYAADEPIYDYHCHLPPDEIADDKSFPNLGAIWLAGDHYKWRAMRANGVEERYCTGDADDREKFMAYARTVSRALRNPLYHWTHLELKRFFGIDKLLDEDSAAGIWEETKEKLAGPELSVRGILESNRVSVICTTDDPVDTLAHHRKIREDAAVKTRVYPTFRPDKALAVDQPQAFDSWIGRLAEVSGIDCGAFDGFLDALKQRHDYFHTLGCRLSDHGLTRCDNEDCTDAEARAIFVKGRSGKFVSPAEAAQFRTWMMVFFGHLDAEKGWTKQLHLGAMRNNNTRLFRKLGPDTGFDSIGDYSQAENLSGYLDRLDRTDQLPKTILYNNNPNDNYILATMIGNFQDGSFPGKMQFGSGWWHLDQKEGMEWQLNALSNLGLLSRFVGMLTDSRSFLSYSRHEYFRRILCNLIGRDVENGELPRDMKLLGGMVRDICFRNAEAYFGLETGKV